MPGAALAPAQDEALRAAAGSLAHARATGECAPLVAALAGVRSLLPSLPAPFGPVLDGIEQRLQSSALFGEESCSFSVNDLFDALDTWLERARLRLEQAAQATTSSC